MAAKIVASATHGKEDPERSTLPFIVGNVAASAEQDAVVLLTCDGVWLATKGYAAGVHHPGLDPLEDVIRAFVGNGGQIWACGACTKPRGITEDRLIPGARIVTAAQVVERLAQGATTLSF
jgi:predicted peroxiredoxin